MSINWDYYLDQKKYPSAWMQTYTGQMFWVLEPDTELIHPIDIAWALAHKCRYNGHTNRFYSVAEHSLFVSDHVDEPYKLWALLHDAAEAYLPDLPRPYKWAMPKFKEIEENLLKVIAYKFDLPLEMPQQVKEIDCRILADEGKALMRYPPPVPWLTPEGLGITDQIANSPYQDDPYTKFKEKLATLVQKHHDDPFAEKAPRV